MGLPGLGVRTLKLFFCFVLTSLFSFFHFTCDLNKFFNTLLKVELNLRNDNHYWKNFLKIERWTDGMWEIMDVRKNFIKVLFLCVFFCVPQFTSCGRGVNNLLLNGIVLG